MRRIQRLVARKMGVPDAEPVPAALAFLADEATMEKSFTNYAAGTDCTAPNSGNGQADESLKPDTKRPEPSEVGRCG